MGEELGKAFYLPTWYGGDPDLQYPTDENTYVAGEGMVVVTAKGQKLLDFGGQAFVNNIGFGRTEVGETMARQARLQNFIAPSRYAGIKLEYAMALAGVLPYPVEVPIFSVGGSDAVEAAIRAARQITHRSRVVTLSHSYHGDTMVLEAVSGTGSEAVQREYAWALHAPSPYHFWQSMEDWSECGERALVALEETLAKADPGTVAALLVEPVMGVAGAVVHPRNYLRGLRKLCDAHGILLVLDEVITGFGRTGMWFGAETLDVRPDMMVLAKGITGGYAPLGATVLRRDHGEELRANGFPYGLTFAGHPVSCAAALKVLEILRREGLVDHSRRKGQYARTLLAELMGEDPGIRDVRGEGLFVGVELRPARGAPLVGSESSAWPRVQAALDALRQRGYILGCSNDGSTLLLCPPFTVEEAQLEELVEALRQVLRQGR